MDRAPAVTLTLDCHPATPDPAVGPVTVTAQWCDGPALRLRYRLHAAPGRILVPPPGPLRRADELWRQTCCEAFLAPVGESRYVELNLSPSRAWALYTFTGEREGMDSPEVSEPPVIAVLQSPTELEVVASVPLATLPHWCLGRRLRLGLSAVVATAAGGRSYWALAHPGPRPDFHRPAGRCAELAPFPHGSVGPPTD